MNKKNTYTMIAVAIVVAIVFFYGGMLYGKSTNTSNQFSNKQFSGNAMNGRQNGMTGGIAGSRNRMSGGGFTNGEVIKKDDNSITVKLTDGGSKIIYFSDKTTIGKMTTGSINDVIIGSSVTANGTASPDGSIIAQTIQLRPAQIK